jgi:hypothetical protein
MKDKTYERFMRHSPILVPVGVSGIGLIGLNIYRFVTPEKHKIIYDSVELALSFAASFTILMYMGGLLKTILVQAFRGLSFNIMTLTFVLYSLVGLLINPFALTLLRRLFPQKEKDPVVLLGILVSTLLTLFFTWAIFIGTRA